MASRHFRHGLLILLIFLLIFLKYKLAVAVSQQESKIYGERLIKIKNSYKALINEINSLEPKEPNVDRETNLTGK